MVEIFKKPLGGTILVIIGVLGSVTEVYAEERMLANDEIQTLLAGNSLKGSWGGSGYCQYFDTRGNTTYQFKGQPATFGRWFVKNNQYCSTWPPSTSVSCYDVVQDDKKIIWKPGPENSAVVVKGKYANC